MTTTQKVYLSRKDPDDDLGETYVIIEANVKSKNITGGLREIDYLIRREILDIVGSSLSSISVVIQDVKTRMNNKYNISSTPETDREIISQINSLIQLGNLSRNDLGDLFITAPFFENYVGVNENSNGVFQTTSIVSNLSYVRTDTSLEITLEDHNIIVGDVVNIENPFVVGFNLTNFVVKETTENKFKVDVTDTGFLSGHNLVMRIPEGNVLKINKYKVLSMLTYERLGAILRVTAPGHGLMNGTKMENHDADVVSFHLDTGLLKNSRPDGFDLDLKEPVGQLSGQNLSLRYILGDNIESYDFNNGLVSRNDIGPSTRTTYVVPGPTSLISSPVDGDGDYLLTVSSGTLRTGVYSIVGSNIIDSVIGGVVEPSHILRLGEKKGGIVDYIKVVTLTSPEVTSSNSHLVVTFIEDHGLIGEQLLFTSLSPKSRLRVSSSGPKSLKIHINIDPVPSEVKVYFTESRQYPQMIERYTVGRRILFKALREIRNPHWNPASKINLPAGLDENAANDPGVTIPTFTSQPGFNKFILNGNGTPKQEYQLLDLQAEVFGSIQRAIDGMRLSIDTSKVARDGVFREYHSNGHLKTRSYYRKFRSLGVLEGLYEDYFENGETRVSYQVIPFHPYNILVSMSVVGKRILIQLDNHNVLVGDTVVLNDSTYVVDDCPNSNLIYINPPILSQTEAETDIVRFPGFNGDLSSDFLSRREGNDFIVIVPRMRFVVTEFLRETGYFQEFIQDRFVYIRQGTILTVIRSQHGLKAGDFVSITNPKDVNFSQTQPEVAFVTENTFSLRVSDSGNRSGRDLILRMPSNIRRAIKIVHGLVESSEYIVSESPRAVFGNSVIHGSYVEFHKSLAFRVRCSFNRGVLQGELIQWDEEGNREYVAQFDRGDLKNREVLNYTFTY